MLSFAVVVGMEITLPGTGGVWTPRSHRKRETRRGPRTPDMTQEKAQCHPGCHSAKKPERTATRGHTPQTDSAGPEEQAGGHQRGKIGNADIVESSTGPAAETPAPFAKTASFQLRESKGECGNLCIQRDLGVAIRCKTDMCLRPKASDPAAKSVPSSLEREFYCHKWAAKKKSLGRSHEQASRPFC